MLRYYQEDAIKSVYTWFEQNETGNPCIVLPTGSGKSHVIAALCKDALQNWPETRILMLTHVKELIEQNVEKVRQHWAGAPLGIYSSGLNIKDLGEPITFAGIQSIRNVSHKIGHVDLVIIDECHLVGHKNEGTYRELINKLESTNPNLRVVGLTATPYRLGHGLITDEPALFKALLEPATIAELVDKKYLSPLRSKITIAKLKTDGVHKRGGEFIESELQAAVDTDANNNAVVDEVIARAGDRKAWLFFCAGVQHAQRVAEVLNNRGIVAKCLVGSTPAKERESIINDFKAGKIKALTNNNVLTTGFDYPDIDLIAMLRPTLSPGLYVQMAGRGMRLKSHTDHCLVLDFAHVVETHGPITAINIPSQQKQGGGEAPTKVCEACHELNPISVKECVACGNPFPIREKPKLKLSNLDIMGLEGQELSVTEWQWRKHISKSSGKEMVAVTYYGGLSDQPVVEYFPICHDGYAGEKARSQIWKLAQKADCNYSIQNAVTPEEVAEAMNWGNSPDCIEFLREGKFYRVTKRIWD